MKTLLCLAGCMSSFSFAAAQSFHYPYGPLFAGNGAYSVHQTGVFSFLSNTASLALCSRAGAGLMAANKYGLRELNSYCAALQMPVEAGAFGFIANWSGSASFNQSQLGLAYAKKLGMVNLGVRFNYCMMRIAGYATEGAISIEAGSTWKITEKFCTGIQVSNPLGKLPAVYSMGMGYECSAQFFISAAVSKEENKPPNLQLVLQYAPIEKLTTMVGFNSGIASPAIAAGWRWKNMQVMISSSFHPQLGASTAMAIIFYGTKKDE